jgi:hypothetical protein
VPSVGLYLDRKHFWTLPLAPQIQARWASPERAKQMKYGWEQMKANLAKLDANGQHTMDEWEDVFDGKDFLNWFDCFNVHDSFILYTCNGAQIYKSKSSDCWYSIALLLNLPIDMRYKATELLPLSIVPGKPKHTDSFNFPVFHKICCLMKEGMDVYNAKDGTIYNSKLYLPFACADGPALVTLDGGVGHSGAHGCHLHCPSRSRHKHQAPHYYPATQCPNDFHVTGSDFPDLDLGTIANWEPDDQTYLRDMAKLLSARTQREFAWLRLETGLTKPSIFLGFPSKNIFGIPGTFALDLFHLPALNAPDLLFSLWRGSMKCDTENGDSKATWNRFMCFQDSTTWKQWGARIGSLVPYIPVWHGRAPRNPAEKMSSGYKGEEYENLVFGLGPQEFEEKMSNKDYDLICVLIRAFEL